MHRLTLIFAALAAGYVATSANAACFDVSKSEPRRLTGVLSPRGQSGSDGLGYVLKLSKPICLSGDKTVDPENPIAEVQVFATEKTQQAFRALANSRVTIELSEPAGGKASGAQSFVARGVAHIFPAEDVAADDAAAAAAVTGFYRALGRGNGEEAANFIVSESRYGALSADAMSRFYGALVAPLVLLSVRPEGSGVFAVLYAFRTSGGQCIGRAIVKTVPRAGVDLISSIKALDGC